MPEDLALECKNSAFQHTLFVNRLDRATIPHIAKVPLLSAICQQSRPKHSGTFAVRIADAFIDHPVRPSIAQGPRGFLRHGIAARMVQCWQRLSLPADVMQGGINIHSINPHVEFLRRFVGGLKEMRAVMAGLGDCGCQCSSGIEDAVAAVGEAVADKKIMDHAVSNLTQIAGQKPVVTLSRKSIAGFKIREGYPIGCMLTLRGNRMYEFLDRLVTIAMPRIRDFRGISGKGFDGRGNYNVGVKEQIIFPEIEYDKIDALRGMNISITTTAKNDEEAKALLAAFKFPFKN